MAKKIIDNTPISNFYDDWGGVYTEGENAGKEWGKTHDAVETAIKNKSREHDAKVSGVRVNNTTAQKDANGVVDISVPIVDTSLSDESPNTVSNAAVTTALNGVKAQPFDSVRTEPVTGDPTKLRMIWTNEAGTDFAEVLIPAAQDMGVVTYPKVTTTLVTPTRQKLGDTIILNWVYDHIRQENGVQSSTGVAAQSVTIQVTIGTQTVYETTLLNVACQSQHTLTLDDSIINQAGTVNINITAITIYEEEQQRARGYKSVNVVTLNLSTSFDPSAQLALNNGYADGQTVTIPYMYAVPTGTTLKVWVDGVLDSTVTIGGSGRGYIYIPAADVAAGRHNVQMIADSAGLLSNAVAVDFRKNGDNTEYLGLRLYNDVEDIEDMPQSYAYGTSSPVALAATQFGELEFEIAAWQSANLTPSVIITAVSPDGVTSTQTITADRTSLHTISQRFDEAGTYTLTITLGTLTRSFGVVVVSAGSIDISETTGYQNKLTATGRSNSEANPNQWVSSGLDQRNLLIATGVNWGSNGWNTENGVTSLLLNNGAVADIDIKPFILDTSDNYSIENAGMTLEIEIKISQVMLRGASVMECLYDNGGSGYPMGIKITTHKAGLYFGGMEEVKTPEKCTNANGDYISFATASVTAGDDISSMGLYEKISAHAYQLTSDTVAASGKTYYEGVVEADSEDAADLYIVRPYGVEGDIAIDQWITVTFICTPRSGTYGNAALFINGTISRANRYSSALVQNVIQSLRFISTNANVQIRSLRYYRTSLINDETLNNFILDRPTAAEIMTAYQRNQVGDENNTTDSDGNIKIDNTTLLSKGKATLIIIRSTDSGNGLTDVFASVNKKQDFLADYMKWTPPMGADNNLIAPVLELWNNVIRIQGTSSVKYPYKNIRIYITKAFGNLTRTMHLDGVDVTSTAKGYALRGNTASIIQSVLCAKTDFVDSSMAGNTGGARLYHNTMRSLDLLTPPQEYDARVRQAIDGIPCDVYAGKSINGPLTYYGQFVMNNEKSKSGGIFGMEDVQDEGTDVEWDMPLALEALDNNSPMTLFHPAGSASSQALADQLAAQFDAGFEFNFPEDAKWANIDEGQWNSEKSKWDVKPVPGARDALKRLMGWIYDCMADTAGVQAGTMTIANPDYGTRNGWPGISKWVSQKFKSEASQYFNISQLLTYYLIIQYFAGKDQLAKNILWRTWDGLKWFPTFYDGDTWERKRNDAFVVYLYNITRDSYDDERSKYAFEGHSSWLWCLVLANFDTELKQCAANLRNVMTNEAMLNEFIGNMIGNWSERQYNKSGKLKYIDTVNTMNYIYTLTGSGKEAITQFLTDRAKLLDAQYGVGSYNDDVITFTVVRNSSDTPSSLQLRSGDLYYYGYKLNGLWLQGPERADVGEYLTMTFSQTLATNDPLMLGGASCITELNFTNMRNQLNGTVNLSLCAMLTKLTMPATYGVANAPLTLGSINKLEYVEITGQTAVNTGTAGVLDLSGQTRLRTLLAGNTGLITVILAEGAPIETLTLPATITSLTLRHLPNLTHSGLTLQGTSDITSLNFADCPYLSWQTLMAQCPNIDHVRIEGISGRVRSSVIRPFMNLSDYKGITTDGREQTYPALLGRVQLIDRPDDVDDMVAFFAHCGLTVVPSQFTEYVFHDEATDPANISNESEQTGYGHSTAYTKKGAVVEINSKTWPVVGYINPSTHKMHVEPLSKSNFLKLIDNITDQNETGDADITGSGTVVLRDVYDYLPKYYYKGVNNYMNATKHLLLSERDTAPESTATVSTRLLLTDVQSFVGRVPESSLVTVGNAMPGLTAVSGYTTYKVGVRGYRQVRFPGMNDNYTCMAFVDSEGVVVQKRQLYMTSSISGNPADFNNTIGDYVFLAVPDTAEYLYFCIPDTVVSLYAASGEVPQGSMGAVTEDGTVTGYYAILLTDSTDIEAIEPDWVEHKAELIGIYQGWAESDRQNMAVGNVNNVNKFHVTSGLRSISGKITLRGDNLGLNGVTGTWTYDSDGNATALPTGTMSGTAQDFFCMAVVRNTLENVSNGKYSSIVYETSKDLANLLMAWFGTRDVENIIGMGGTAAYYTGTRNSVAFGDTAKSGTANSANTQQLNKAWGIEGVTGSMLEWTDGGSLNAPSQAAFVKAHRLIQSAWVVDDYYNILQQDGRERRVKAERTNQRRNVARVRFGRHCDIIVSSYAGDSTYATCYCAFQSTGAETDDAAPSKGRVLGRSGSNAVAGAGVACSNSYAPSRFSGAYYGARLCFFGEIENESDVKA